MGVYIKTWAHCKGTVARFNRNRGLGKVRFLERVFDDFPSLPEVFNEAGFF
jgi:hypothetical protein